jgi:hypothetical protein
VKGRSTFHSADLWERISVLARRKARRWAAVPFLGTGASRQLPLARGDILVSRFDDAALRSGLVHPDEVLRFIQRGVHVHSVLNLHAKVFVFGTTAVIGSANVSRLSRSTLIEAAVVTTSPGVVRSARAFVEALVGDELTPEFVKKKRGLYRPPRLAVAGTRPGRHGVPQQSSLWALALEEIEFDEVDDLESAKAVRDAEPRLSGPEYRVETIRWPGGRLLEQLRIGDRVLGCTTRGRAVTVAAPERVLAVRKYRSARGVRAAIALERRKWTREKPLAEVIRRAGPSAKPLRHLAGSRRLGALAVWQIGQLFGGVAHRPTRVVER